MFVVLRAGCKDARSKTLRARAPGIHRPSTKPRGLHWPVLAASASLKVSPPRTHGWHSNRTHARPCIRGPRRPHAPAPCLAACQTGALCEGVPPARRQARQHLRPPSPPVSNERVTRRPYRLRASSCRPHCGCHSSWLLTISSAEKQNWLVGVESRTRTLAARQQVRGCKGMRACGYYAIHMCV